MQPTFFYLPFRSDVKVQRHDTKNFVAGYESALEIIIDTGNHVKM